MVDRIIAGEQGREDKSGFEATIRQLVRLTGAGLNRICDAHNDAQTYDIGDAHPCFSGIYCADKVTRPHDQDNQSFWVDYVFRALDPEDSAGGAFSMAGSLAEVEATRDRDDAQVVLSHTYPVTYKDPILAGQTRSQVAEWQAAKPTLLLRWSRLQNSFGTAWGNRAVLGTVNDALQWGFAAELLLCTRMEIEQSGQKWREIFEFQTTNSSWTVPVTFRQEDDGRPVENPVLGTDEKNVQVYPAYNYSLLGLLLPS